MARVLIVDDDPHVGTELAAELEIRGYEVTLARDAAAGAPAAVRTAPAVVVVDYFLPLGDGIELTRQWKTCEPPPVVLLVSGADISAEVASRLPPAVRPDRILAKPVAISLLAGEIGRLVSPPATARPERRPKTPIVQPTAGLPEVLWQLWRAQRSGTLALAGTETHAIVHVLNGDPVFVEAASLDETVGRLLVRDAVITRDQYQRVLRKVTDDLIAGEDIRFGEIVVEMGFASAEQVIDTLRAQVREKLVNLFHAAQRIEVFRDGHDELDIGTAFRVDAAEVLLAGIRRHYGVERMAPSLEPHLDRYASLTPAFEEHRRRFRFSGGEERFLEQVRGERTVRALVEGAGLDRIHAMQIVYALTIVGAIATEPDAAPRARPARRPSVRTRAVGERSGAEREQVLKRHLQVTGRSHYDILGVRPEAGAEEVEAAFRRLAARWAPERLVTLALGDAHERATQLWAQIARAHDTLADPARRAAYDAERRRRAEGSTPAIREKRSEPFAAETAMQRGIAELDGGRVVNAMVEFGRARALAPREPEYACYELWAGCLQAIAQGMSAPVVGREARARMEAALVGRRPRPRALYLLALTSQLADEPQVARDHLRAALAFAPDFVEARRLLDRLTPRPAVDLG